MTKRDEIIEAMARAIWLDLYGDDEPMREGTVERALQLQCAAKALDAALLAMMEPSEEMAAHALEKLDENGRYVSRGYIDRGDAITAFTAMLTTLQAKA